MSRIRRFALSPTIIVPLKGETATPKGVLKAADVAGPSKKAWLPLPARVETVKAFARGAAALAPTVREAAPLPPPGAPQPRATE